MNINPEYLARFRAVIVGLDNAPRLCHPAILDW